MILIMAFFISCSESTIDSIDIDTEILLEMEELAIPSVVACVVDSNAILWEGSYGFANIEYAIPATSETIYSLQSITKLFLSISTFQLWEKNQIDLHEDINSYLPFVVRNPYYPDSAITPYMLLNHTSSLAWPADGEDIPDFHHFYSDEEPPAVIEWIPEYILPDGEFYRGYVWKNFPPGEMYLYSNIGTSLLAVIIEEISGMDYRDYCKENILEPLGMTTSTFYLSELDAEKTVTPYNDENGPMQFFSSRHYPAGFLNCSALDFSKFTMAVLNGGSINGNRILKKSTMIKMLEVQAPQVGVSYLWDHYIGGTFGHIGGGTGFSTSVEWNLESGKAFFIFTNTRNNSVYHFGRIYQLVKLISQETIPPS